ncbi:hypothetical protein NHX12_006068, partial [Muraenolepis orangiensis]
MTGGSRRAAGTLLLSNHKHHAALLPVNPQSEGHRVDTQYTVERRRGEERGGEGRREEESVGEGRGGERRRDEERGGEGRRGEERGGEGRRGEGRRGEERRTEKRKGERRRVWKEVWREERRGGGMSGCSAMLSSHPGRDDTMTHLQHSRLQDMR